MQRHERRVNVIEHTREAELNGALELLHFAFRAVVERPDAILAEHGLGRAHHRILYFVGRHPGCSVGELLAILRVSKQALNAPLRRLVRDGWVAASPAPENRRLKRLRLTEAGAAVEERLSGDQRARFARVFAAAGPEAESAWRAIMRDLAESGAATHGELTPTAGSHHSGPVSPEAQRPPVRS